MKKIIMSISVFLLICGIFVAVDFSLRANAQTGNTLSVKYLEDFPGGVNFDSEYRQVDKYLVYKYVEFSFDEEVTVNSVGLSFLVDNDWYNRNDVKDVIFLRFNRGNWSRVGYDSKFTEGSYIKYGVTSDAIGQYWAIVGVLPERNETSGNTTSITRIEQGKATFETVGEIKAIEDVIKVGEDMIITLKEPINVKGASTITTTTATVSVAALLAFLGGPANLWIVFQQIGMAFFGLFFSKKRHRSGVVYDAGTGMPIPLARVNLVDKEDDRIKSAKFTDKNGRYYFLAPKGSYYLEVRKKGYVIVERGRAHLLKALLHESDLESEVRLSESGIIKKNIAILQDDAFFSHGKIKTFLLLMLKYLSNVLFFAGMGISLWSCYVNPILFNFFVLGIYLLILAFKSFFAKNPKYGTIVDSSGRLEPFATINVLDAKTKKMVSRAISNTKGRYYILLEEGEYILNIKTVKGVSVSQRISVEGHNILSHKLVIQK